MAKTLNAEPPAWPGDIRDDDGVLLDSFVDAVHAALAAGDAVRLDALVTDLHESDLGALIEVLDPGERPRLIELLGGKFDFTALTEVDDAVREEILDELPNATIAQGVRNLESDDAVYILEDLAEEDKTEVLGSLTPLERVALKRSLDYPEGSAGRRMQSDLIAVPPFWTVGQTIDFMRETSDLPDEFYELFVVAPTGEITGHVPLNKLLRAQRPQRIEAIMDDADHVARASDEQANVADLFKRYNLVSIPVVDESDRLVGVLTFDDIVDVLDEEADAEIRALGGVKADEELSDSVWMTARARFSWLFVNLLTAIAASAVIGLFEGAIQKMVALAVLMPIVASQGGNAGTQTMTVAVRALATRTLSPHNASRIVMREVLVGLFNGIAFAALLGAVAALWFGQIALGYVIGIAMVANLIAAGLAGILIPLGLDRARIDPAVASGPFVTTVTDIVGFFAFLGVASLWFGI